MAKVFMARFYHFYSAQHIPLLIKADLQTSTDVKRCKCITFKASTGKRKTQFTVLMCCGRQACLNFYELPRSYALAQSSGKEFCDCLFVLFLVRDQFSSQNIPFKFINLHFTLLKSWYKFGRFCG